MKLVIVLAAALLSACAVWPASDDPKGRELKARGAVVLAALERFRQERGHLPKSLGELAPGLLPAVPSEPKLRFNAESGLLEFVYSPSWPQPGQVSCSAVVGSKEWRCGGYI